jgi:serine/threonine-protein kinase
MAVLDADAQTQRRTFAPNDEFYSPDCDHVPMPVPAGGNLENEDGYECTTDGDCHLIVFERDENKLYEMWRANIIGGEFSGGCLAVWDLGRVYGPEGRGEQCTSADAAGFPIAPLLFTADEVAAGEIPHAIRFILPNPRMRARTYVRPATHAGGPSGPPQAPPYGVRLRLRADFPLETLPNDGARTVARAMQKYGMLLADGGNVALTARSDRRTTAKWDGLLDARDLQAIQPRDFEVVEMGEIIAVTNDCERTPL